jgi:hypothetical protein
LAIAGGELDQEGRALSFFDEDAHAWVQIKTSTGWVYVDPTPPSLNPVEKPRRKGRAAQLTLKHMTVLPDAQQELSELPQDATVTIEEGHAPEVIFVLSAIVCLGLIGLVFIVIALARRSRSQTCNSVTRRDARLVHAIEMAFRRLGYAWPRDITLQEQLKRAERDGISAPALRDASRYLYDTCFGGKPHDHARERSLRHALHKSRLPDPARRIRHTSRK